MIYFLNFIKFLFFSIISTSAFSAQPYLFKTTLEPMNKSCAQEINNECSKVIINRASKLINVMNYCLLDMSERSFCLEMLEELESIIPVYNELVKNNQEAMITQDNLILLKKILNSEDQDSGNSLEQ